MPKLLLNACGDQFFLPDSSQFYFSDLPGTKYLRYVPNADHSLKGSDAYETLLAWHQATLSKTALPQFDWKHAAPGDVQVTARTKPVEVKLWQANNPTARDFRVETLGPVWKSTPLTASDAGAYAAKVAKPDNGWTAYMVELTYDIGAATKLKVTTDVRVIPDTLPHPAPKPSHAAK
jgi:PhoPQ-activated pathogenicity-related protein